MEEECSLRIGDLEEDAIVVSNDEEEVETPPSSEGSYHVLPLAERIGPVSTGQQAVRPSPGYREAREHRKQEKSKAEELEPTRGHVLQGRGLPNRSPRGRGSTRRLSPFSQAERNILLLNWGFMKKTARKRIKMLEKVPPMAFYISSPTVRAPPLSPSRLP